MNHRHLILAAAVALRTLVPVCATAETTTSPAVASEAAAPADSLAKSEQKIRRHELTAGWSPRLMLRKDEIFSPRTTKGASAFGITFGHDWQGPKTAQRSGFDFSKALAKTRPLFEYGNWRTGETAQTEATPFTSLRLDHAILRQVALPAGRFTLRVGGAVDLDFQAFDWVWHPDAIGGYSGILALDARAELEAHLGARHDLRLTLSTPALAWVARSPYAVNDSQNFWNNRDANPVKTLFRYLSQGRFQTVDSHQALRVKLRYAYQLTPSYGLVLTAHGRLTHLKNPRPLLASEWGVSLATSWTF